MLNHLFEHLFIHRGSRITSKFENDQAKINGSKTTKTMSLFLRRNDSAKTKMKSKQIRRGAFI